MTNAVGSDNLFSTLGIAPVLGRSFRQEDGAEGAPNVVLLTAGFWQRRLGGDPDAVGGTLTLDGMPYTIVGVLPEGFFFMNQAELWLPMRPDRDAEASRDKHTCTWWAG